ncbi:MAG: hypothetical protein FJW79_10470 [Actinobacteria bacterium]|nr:hypothetical protein [Actinomycetota bacterium]
MTGKRVAAAAAALLVVALVAGASSPAGKAGAADQKTVTRTITVPAGAFTASDDNIDFVNGGNGLSTSSGGGTFAAALFLESRDVTIKSITLYATDNNAGENVCLHLYRTTPWNAQEQKMGTVCSSGADLNPRAFNVNTLDYRKISGAYGPYLWVYLPTNVDLYFHAARLVYTY